MYEDILIARYIIAALLVILLSMAGCAQMNLGSTKITYKDFTYDSNKNQENLKAKGKINPATGLLEFEVETTAVTPEAAIAASAAAQLRLIELMEKLVPLIPKPVP